MTRKCQLGVEKKCGKKSNQKNCLKGEEEMSDKELSTRYPAKWPKTKQHKYAEKDVKELDENVEIMSKTRQRKWQILSQRYLQNFKENYTLNIEKML
ncbi:hypothetical protein QE152_g9877 [Popillia japonica]|uniref:Uncharacterized protein n=1 Tax=Popillia japonica TaxID=7064 RepID=A0AAW1LWX3_POPJA